MFTPGPSSKSSSLNSLLDPIEVTPGQAIEVELTRGNDGALELIPVLSTFPLSVIQTAMARIAAQMRRRHDP